MSHGWDKIGAMNTAPAGFVNGEERFIRMMDKYMDRIGFGYFYDFKGRPIDAEQFEALARKGRHVGSTHLRLQGRKLWVSTVLLGTDMRFGFGGGRPIIFETMVFQETGKEIPGIDALTSRYCTKREAEIGHHYTVKFLKMVLKRRRPLINKGGKP